MNTKLLNYYLKLRALADAIVADESGQDLVEYALVLSLIVLGCAASMPVVATSVSAAFSRVGSKFSNYTS